jgi:hypothetical protein
MSLIKHHAMKTMGEIKASFPRQQMLYGNKPHFVTLRVLF